MKKQPHNLLACCLDTSEKSHIEDPCSEATYVVQPSNRNYERMFNRNAHGQLTFFIVWCIDRPVKSSYRCSYRHNAFLPDMAIV